MVLFRVGEGTVPLAIVIYIDGSFIKHSIPVKPIYITVRNLDSVVSGKAMAWRVLGMLPSFKKSATPSLLRVVPCYPKISHFVIGIS